MISIDYIHQLTYNIAAKQLTAFPSPAGWNNYAQQANIDLFNYYNDEREKMLLKVKSGEALFAPPVLSTFVVNEYPMSPSVMAPSLPNNYAYDIAFKTPVNGINKTIQKVDYGKLESYLNSTIDQPTASNPIYVELSDSLVVYPTINYPTYLTYYRYPVTPIWNYTVVDGVPVYNSSGSVDFEFDQSEIVRITMRILNYMSISIRDQELEQYAQQMTIQSS
jgi:hypothetical protein